MKKLTITLIFTLIVLMICSGKYSRYVYEHTDHEAPVITILQDDLLIYEDDEINFLDYVDIEDDSGKYTVNIINNFVSFTKNRIVGIRAEDETGNVSVKYIHYSVISNEEWNKFVKDNTYNYYYRNINNNHVKEIKGKEDHEAFKLALEFVGMKGGCNEVAQAFIDEYYGSGYDVLNTYPISLEEAKAGDIVFYINGGLGLQHYAVYLGGASALQGNINGTTVIGSVYMTHGSVPQFRRLVGLE